MQLTTDDHVKKSFLEITATPDDDEAILTCRVQNPKLSPTTAMEDSHKLHVKCKLTYYSIILPFCWRRVLCSLPYGICPWFC